MNSLIVACSSCGRKNRIPADKQHLRPQCGNCKAAIDMKHHAAVVELGDGDFHDFISHASLPVMVDFFSPTCGPCQSMMPVVERMAREHYRQFLIAKVDTSRHQQVASSYRIQGVPTFMFFKAGKLVDQIAGAVPAAVLAQKLKSL